MNGAYFTVDTVFAPMYKRFASARQRRRREKKRRGEMNMKSSGSASSLSMMMASALRSDVDEETDAADSITAGYGANSVMKDGFGFSGSKKSRKSNCACSENVLGFLNGGSWSTF